MNTNYTSILCIFFTILIIFFIYNNIMGNSSKNTNFLKINKTLDKEHKEIFKAIDKLYDACDKHWRTEDKMYKKGVKLMPPGHNKMDNEWKEHVEDHKNLLKQIKEMKKNIIKHIKEKDGPHFHWTN
jgi:hypothetical protein